MEETHCSAKYPFRNSSHHHDQVNPGHFNENNNAQAHIEQKDADITLHKPIAICKESIGHNMNS